MKKLLILWTSVVAIGFVIPSLATAAEATCPPGTRCPVGTEIRATGSSLTFTTNNVGSLTCTTLSFDVKVTQNDGTNFAASGNTINPTQTACYDISPEKPVTVTEFNVTKLAANEAKGPSGSTKNTTMSFTATYKLPSGITCKFTGTNVPGTYVSGASPAKLTFNKAAGITSTGGCGSATFDGSLILEIKGTTTPVITH